MAITLVRHTTPAIAKGVCYGRTDLATAETFDNEALEVLACLPFTAHRIVSSPLQRCSQLASVIGDKHGVDVHIDDRLQEMDFGTWEGRPWAEIERNELDGWAENFLHGRPHGGETVAELRTRTLDVLGSLAHENRQIVVVTHSGIIKAALAAGDTPVDFSSEVGFGGAVCLV